MTSAPALTGNARRVLEARYLRRDADGRVVETPEGLFRRVARAAASAEVRFRGREVADRFEDAFFELMAALEFLPNSPTLMNAGTASGQLAACFVLPVEDDLGAIFDTLRLAALIQQSGGGTGFSFSRLRPAGDLLARTGGTASGPVSFLRVFDCATENVRLGGRRRGANMGVLRADHPDVEAFVGAKSDGRSLRNFNLSVGATDAFFEAAATGRPFPLRHPATGREVRSVDAAGLLRGIAEAAHETGDPGLLFLDAINRANPTPALGAIEATNPCGEVPLLPYEACVLGSLNLSRMVRGGEGDASVDWAKLENATRLAVRFLDDLIETGTWPDPRIERAVAGNRKIGLGVMGFAELLIRLGIPYDSDRAVATADELMRHIADRADEASAELAAERGSFPNWERSVYAADGRKLRNATRTSIAPTGSIGILAGTSPGIEPLYALAFRREGVLGGETLGELSDLFLWHARRHGYFSERLAAVVAERGTLEGLPGVPESAKALFRTASEIPAERHLAVQAAFQRHCDNAVSKTVNLSASATVAEVEAVYLRAWRLGVKGVTVFRDGSRGGQVLRRGVTAAVDRPADSACCPCEPQPV